MEDFNACLINTISALSQPGEIPSLKKATRICREFRSLLIPVNGDARLNQRGAQTWQGSVGRGAQPHPGELCHTNDPSISSQHHKSVFPYPLGMLKAFLTSLPFPFLGGGSSNAPRQVLAVPGPIPQGCGRFHPWQEGIGCPTSLIYCLQGNGSSSWLLHGMQKSSYSRLG